MSIKRLIEEDGIHFTGTARVQKDHAMASAAEREERGKFVKIGVVTIDRLVIPVAELANMKIDFGGEVEFEVIIKRP